MFKHAVRRAATSEVAPPPSSAARRRPVALLYAQLLPAPALVSSPAAAAAAAAALCSLLAYIAAVHAMSHDRECYIFFCQHPSCVSARTATGCGEHNSTFCSIRRKGNRAISVHNVWTWFSTDVNNFHGVTDNGWRFYLLSAILSVQKHHRAFRVVTSRIYKARHATGLTYRPFDERDATGDVVGFRVFQVVASRRILASQPLHLMNSASTMLHSTVILCRLQQENEQFRSLLELRFRLQIRDYQ